MMNNENSKKTGLKENITHQLEDLAEIFSYLAFFFCAIATYRLLLLNEFHVAYFDYSAALINALVVAKVILLGQDAHLGKKHESKPLFISAVYKAFLYGLLVFTFHVVEEAVKRLWHGDKLAGSFHDVHADDILARSVIIFCAFIPLFSFLELRRVLGEGNFHDLLFRSRAKSALISRQSNEK